MPPENRAGSSARFSGDLSAVVPPVPIPNTEVKRCSPDGSATIGCARVGRRQNKTPAEVILGGRFAFLDPPSPVARKPLVGGRSSGAFSLQQRDKLPFT